MRLTLRRIAAAVIALASGLVIVSAQSSDTFVPVTDAMLQDPAPGDWLTWRAPRRVVRHARRPGGPGRLHTEARR